MPLVPFHRRAEFQHHLAAAERETRVERGELADAPARLTPDLGGGLAQMHRDGVALALDPHPLEIGETLAQPVLEMVELGEPFAAEVVPDAPRSGDLEAVRAGIIQRLDADPPAHVLEIATAYHRHEGACRHMPQGVGELGLDAGEIGMFDDRRERPVEVQEQSETSLTTGAREVGKHLPGTRKRPLRHGADPRRGEKRVGAASCRRPSSPHPRHCQPGAPG